MGQLLSVCGARDGEGKTTFALHLAYGLSKIGNKTVCLVEADVANLGDLGVALNSKGNKTFVDLVKQINRLDPKLLQTWVTKHPLGMHLLDGATFTTDFQALDDALTDKAFKLLTRSFDYVILDLGRDFNPLTFRALENSQAIFVVMAANVFSVNQAAEYSKKLRSLQFGSEVQKIVLNRYDSKSIITPTVIKQKFQMDPIALLPEDPAALNQTIALAKPLQLTNSKHPYLKGIDDSIRFIQSLDSKVEKSRVTKAVSTNSLDALKQVLPFTYGEAGGSSRKILERGSISKPIMDRNIAIRARVHDRLLELVDLRQMDAVALEKDPKKKEELRNKTIQAIQRLLEEEAREIENRNEKAELAKDILDEALGLGPVEPLLEALDVSEIMVNGKDQIFVERKGKLTLTDYRFTSDKHLLGCIERIVSPIGRRVDEKTPLCDARLPDGSRINIIIPPLSLKGPVITIRKFFKERLTINDLIKYGSLTDEMSDFLRAAVMSRLNIIVSGGTGSGKTTLLNMVAGFIPEDERIVTVEDAAELQLPQVHVITLESKPANLQGEGAIAIRDLVRNALRMRPDRIVVGECRAGEALDMLQAMNTGHDGSLTTIHSNNPRDCIRRIETLVMMAGFDLPMQAIREQIASAVNLIVQLKRYSDGARRISHVTEVIGIEGDTVVTQPIFEFKQTGVDEKGKVKGSYQPSGLIPKFVETLKAKGIAPPKGLFGGGPQAPKTMENSNSSPTQATSTGTPTRPTLAPAPMKPPLPKPNMPIRNPQGIKKP
ncbi:MAG: Flp pilus assembly protein TadA [Bacteriovoracaceae bacterium]|nr:Flp pilus assembly protein TadA [Bacteriovoracaceae bacterium]